MLGVSQRSSDQNGWQPPEVQLLSGQPVGFTLGTVVELILSQLLLTGEGFQTAFQADWLSLGPTGLVHTAVLLHDLQTHHGRDDAAFTERNKMQKYFSSSWLDFGTLTTNLLPLKLGKQKNKFKSKFELINE